MKTNTLLALATLAVLTTTVSAAANQTTTAVYVLPTYVVTAPRQLPVERVINEGLKELRQQALAPRVIVPAPSALQPVAASKLAIDSRVVRTIGKS